MRVTTAGKLRLGAEFLHKLIDVNYGSPTYGTGGLWPWKRVPKPKGERRGLIWAVPLCGIPPWVHGKQAETFNEPTPFLPHQEVIT